MCTRKQLVSVGTLVVVVIVIQSINKQINRSINKEQQYTDTMTKPGVTG